MILIYPKIEPTTGIISFDSNAFGTGGMIAAYLGLFCRIYHELIYKNKVYQ